MLAISRYDSGVVNAEQREDRDMNTDTTVRRISTEELYRIIHMEEGIEIIDVRTSAEYSERRIAGSTNFPCRIRCDAVSVGRCFP